MATTPTTPAAPKASPTTARPTPGGRKGQMTFGLSKLTEPLILQQDTIEHKWNMFKTVMVFLGGIAILAWLSFVSFVGGWSAAGHQTLATPSIAAQPATSVVSPVQQNTAPPQPQWSSYADCQRHYVLTLRRDPEGACDSFK